jgi:hypothetical protein
MHTSTLHQPSRGAVRLSRDTCRASSRQHLRQLRSGARCSAAVSHEQVRPFHIGPADAGLHHRLRTSPTPTSTQAAATPSSITKVTLRTKKTSALGVSIYPIFKYNASGGGGDGSVEQRGDKLQVVFDASKLLIPALSWRTASMFGVPIPPPLKIDIYPSRLEVRLLLVACACMHAGFSGPQCGTPARSRTLPA